MNHHTRFIVQYRTDKGPFFLKSLLSKDKTRYSVWMQTCRIVSSQMLVGTAGSETNTSGQGLWTYSLPGVRKH